MIITHTNLYAADQLMSLKSSTGLQSFINTVWNGVPIMVIWNHLANGIMQIWPENIVEEEDLYVLENLIKLFLEREGL